MRKKLYKLLVTGGAGFIGSEFVRQAVKKGYQVVVVDKLTYAGDLARLKEAEGKFVFYKKDICDARSMDNIIRKYKPNTVIHFAAETHVDRSILSATSFIETNVKGTQVLMDVCRKYLIKKILHISTDEVYGEIYKGKFHENSPLRPNSPYAASKAAADCLIRSYVRTYKFPAIIIRPSNNYGPWQYPEKFIPVVIQKALTNKKIPIYGKGNNVREWLHVSDCVSAIFVIMKSGKKGAIYNLGSGKSLSNVMTARKILKALHKPPQLIQFVKDRPGHDFRYSLNSVKIRTFGWSTQKDFSKGIIETAQWFEKNKSWLQKKARGLKAHWKKVYQVG